MPSPPQRTNQEIIDLVAVGVAAGRIKPELAHLYERALQDEAEGRGTIMRDPQVRRCPPRRPSWARRCE
jgi:hypothetical protein